jgi:putative protease
MGIFRAMLRHGADGVLVRNLSGLAFFVQHGAACIADFSLNAANELTVDELLQRGAARVTPSFDLNRDQLLALVAHTCPSRLEIVVHQHMPMFHMEHCVFCAVLSPGTNKTNCGRPCDHHDVRLRDRIGAEHPLKADVGCRNTVFNATPQSGAELVPELLQRGACHFRIEFLDDAPQEIGRTIALYRQLLDGEATGRDVWTALRAMNRVGVTRGTLEERRDPLAIV